MRGPSLPRSIPPLALAAALALGLSGCGGDTMTAFDATAYVRGVLDETYKGTWDNAFLDLVDLTDGEAQDAYEAALEEEYRRFAYQFDLNDAALTDETRQAALDLLAQVCALAQYTVQGATALDDTRYAVEVSVRPLDLFLQVRSDALAGFREEFAQTYAGVDLEGLTEEERAELEAEYENQWALGIIGLCEDRLGLAGYGEVERILVLVAPDDQGYYSMGDNDFNNLSTLILPY